MDKKSIYFKNKSLLIENIIKEDLVYVLKEPNYLSKLFKKRVFADVYFHNGILDEKSIEYIKNSKVTITNSFSSMNLILAKTKVSHEKVKVIYPTIDIEDKDEHSLKQKYKEEFALEDSTKIIFFTAKNFKKSGIKEFLDICSNLTFIDFKAIIVGSKQQLNALEFLLPKYQKLEQKIITIEESKNIDEIFLISDIFLLPTQSKPFASNIIKAMFCKCVVFLPVNNDAKEIIDVYASMDNPSDPSTSFKIDAILYDENELKKIKEDNHNIAKECSLSNNLDKFNSIIKKI